MNHNVHQGGISSLGRGLREGHAGQCSHGSAQRANNFGAKVRTTYSIIWMLLWPLMFVCTLTTWSGIQI